MAAVTEIEVHDMQRGYLQLLDQITKRGRSRVPRGLETLDLGYTVVHLTNPAKATPVDVGRSLNLTLASAETTQLIACTSDVAQLISITPAFSAFNVDDRQPGAYGPRIKDQMPQIVRELSTDGESRRAVATIWRSDELEIDSPDYPCTIALHWSIDGDRLNMITTMRSNDGWLGVPYDFTMFTRLQLTLAWCLGVQVGTYTHTAWSMHIYKRDLAKLDALHEPQSIVNSPVPPFTSTWYDTRPGERCAATALNRWRRANAWARTAMMNLPASNMTLPPYALWHAERLRPHYSDGLYCKHCGYVLPRTSQHFYTHYLANKWKGTCKRCSKTRYKKTPESRFASRCARYGVTPEWFKEQLERQDHVCAICRSTPNNGRYKDFVIDHDHATGLVRGLLCSNCNYLLGLADDDIERLDRAIRYLRGTS